MIARLMRLLKEVGAVLTDVSHEVAEDRDVLDRASSPNATSTVNRSTSTCGLGPMTSIVAHAISV